MSTPDAQPSQANGNNRVVRGRHTAPPVVDDAARTGDARKLKRSKYNRAKSGPNASLTKPLLADEGPSPYAAARSAPRKRKYTASIRDATGADAVKLRVPRKAKRMQPQGVPTGDGWRVIPYSSAPTDASLWESARDIAAPWLAAVAAATVTHAKGPTNLCETRYSSRRKVATLGSINSTDDESEPMLSDESPSSSDSEPTTPVVSRTSACRRAYDYVAGKSYAAAAAGFNAAADVVVHVSDAVKEQIEPDGKCHVRPDGHMVKDGGSGLTITNGGDFGATTNRPNRILRPDFSEYVLPKLDVYGSTSQVTDPDIEGFITDGALRCETGLGFKVLLPSCVVDQGIAFLAGKGRTLATQRLLYNKVNEIIRDLDLSPKELAVSAWFAPLVVWSQTEAAHIDHGVYMRKTFMGKPVWARIATAMVTAATILPTAAAGAIAGVPIAVTTPFFAVAALAVVTAATTYTAWSYGLSKPAVGPRYEPALYTKTSVAKAPEARKENAKVASKREPPTEEFDATKAVVTPVGFGDRQFIPIALATNRANELLALEARVLAATPKPDPEVAKDFVAWAKRNAFKILGNNQQRPFRIEPMDFDAWLEGCNCNAATKQVYRQTYDDLTLAGVSHDSVLNPGDLFKYTTRKSFVKLETTLHRSAQKAPRLIQGAQPEMTVLTGPWFVAFQGWLKRRLHPAKSGLVYAPGQDQRAIADLLGALDGIANITEDDVSTYDASIGLFLGEFEIWVCERFGIPRASRDLYKANLKKHGYTRHGFKYEVEGTRASGDTGTSALNTLLNLFLHAYIFCTFRDKPIEWEEAEQKLVVVATGDDDVIGDKSYTNVDWKGGMRALGFDSKPIPRPLAADVEFCSCILLPCTYPDGDGWALLPKLGRMISKAMVSLRVRKDEDRLGILRGTALSLLGVVSCSPPHRSWVRRALELTAGATPIRPDDEPWKLRHTNSGTDNERTHAALNARYGWTAELQNDWDAELAKVNQNCMFGDMPISASFQAKDSDDVYSGPMTSLQHSGVAPNSIVGAIGHEQALGYVPPEPRGMFDDDGADVDDEKFDLGYAQYHNMRVGGESIRYLADGSTYAEVFAKPYLSMRFMVGQREVNPTHVAAHDFEVLPKGFGGVIPVATMAVALHRIADGVASHAAECIECADAVADMISLSGWHAHEPAKVEVYHPEPDAVKCTSPSPQSSPSAPLFTPTQPGAHTSSPARFVAFQGKTRVYYVRRGLSYGGAFMEQFDVPLDKLSMFVFTGLPGATWTSEAVADFSVRAKGFGGSGSNVSKAEKLLTRIMEATGVDEMSKGALLNMVDGFHDHPVRSNGFPDNVCAPSVPECYKTSITISAPTGVTGNWDANVVLFPDLATNGSTSWQNPTGNSNANNYTNTWLNTTTGSSTAFPGPLLLTPGGLKGGLCVGTGAAGSVLNDGAFTNQLDVLPTRAMFGPSRVYGMAFEVINNTAPLYQQGTCAVWRQPMPDPRSGTTQTFTATAGGGSIPIYYHGVADMVIAPTPPYSLAEAMVLQGTRQWHAKEGCMVVSTMNGNDLPVLNGQCSLTGYSYNLENVGFVLTACPTAAGGVFASGSTFSTATMGFPRTYNTPFNMSGAFFSGLSNSTTLTINVRIFCEIFPSDLQNPLTPLAQPSCPYDERALRLYSEIAKSLPPGVMLCENGFGDFFSDIISKVSNFVAPIAGVVSKVASFIPHPAAQGVARIADMVGGVASQFRGGNGQMMPESEQVYAAPDAPRAPPIARTYAPARRQQLVIPKQPKLRPRKARAVAVAVQPRSRIPVLRRR